MRNVLNFIASVDVSPNTYFLHLELLNFMIIAMSTQLLCEPSPRSNDVNPFLDAVMAQDGHLVSSVVCKLLLNYITCPINAHSRRLYDARRRTANQIYMLIILLILSQDSSFNAGIHKLILPTIPWYKERLLLQSSLDSLMIIILIRTVLSLDRT
ncbi:hypothetical protein PHAVU_007G263800 [Phaseolus vulgaris]|uniref:Dymeclin n=1 Tax=Phaseolus vulgaris TaxID=3885 RepID=V7BL08_PHAVU|nr:hypothetical protein PHAVU_007G263800g [Phaseolus vulgaris]ESW17735.1 hypothetical protein PHAVU_007G263800g [Phaseolus vulgaris]